MQENKKAREEKLKVENNYMWAFVDCVEEKVDECICIYFVHTFVVDQWYVWLLCLGVEDPVTTFHVGLSMPLGCLFLQGQAKMRWSLPYQACWMKTFNQNFELFH